MFVLCLCYYFLYRAFLRQYISPQRCADKFVGNTHTHTHTHIQPPLLHPLHPTPENLIKDSGGRQNYAPTFNLFHVQHNSLLKTDMLKTAAFKREDHEDFEQQTTKNDNNNNKQ